MSLRKYEQHENAVTSARGADYVKTGAIRS